MSRARPEEVLHRTVAAFLDVALPEGATWTTIEPGGYRTKAEAGIAKARGVKACYAWRYPIGGGTRSSTITNRPAWTRTGARWIG